MGGQEGSRPQVARAEERHPEVFDARSVSSSRPATPSPSQGNVRSRDALEAVRRRFTDRVCWAAPDPEAAARASTRAVVRSSPWLRLTWSTVISTIRLRHSLRPAPLAARSEARSPRLGRAAPAHRAPHAGLPSTGTRDRGPMSLPQLGLCSARGAVGLGVASTSASRCSVTSRLATRRPRARSWLVSRRWLATARRGSGQVELARLREVCCTSRRSAARQRLVLASVMLDRLVRLSPRRSCSSGFSRSSSGSRCSCSSPLRAPASSSRERPPEHRSCAACYGGAGERVYPDLPVSFRRRRGITHAPDTREPDGCGCIVNLGSGEGKPEDHEKTPYRAARTHLVVSRAGGSPRAELRAEGRQARSPQTLSCVASHERGPGVSKENDASTWPLLPRPGSFGTFLQLGTTTPRGTTTPTRRWPTIGSSQTTDAGADTGSDAGATSGTWSYVPIDGAVCAKRLADGHHRSTSVRQAPRHLHGGRRRAGTKRRA